MSLQRDYIFPRPGTNRLYLRFQYPDGTEKVRSLRTSCPIEAAARAAPAIAEHKKRVWEAHNRRRGETRVESMDWLFPLGISQLEGGIRVFADERRAVLIHPDGRTEETQNGQAITSTYLFDPESVAPFTGGRRDGPCEHLRPRSAPQNLDWTDEDAIVDAWAKKEGITGYLKKEADDVLALYKRVVGQPIAKATCEATTKLVDYLFANGRKGKPIKSASVGKLIGHLRAATNLAIRQGKLTFNPFAAIVPHLNDSEKRDPYDEEEMATVRARLHELEPDERLLWVLLSTTGMRVGEAFQVNLERLDRKGIRYTIIGTKTDSSQRRIPFPDTLLPFLPQKITGPLFPGESEDSLPKRLQRRVRAMGLNWKNTSLHSLRHRAKDRMRDSELDIETKINDAVTGHGEVTVGDGYGRGQPNWKLKRAIDTIGF